MNRESTSAPVACPDPFEPFRIKLVNGDTHDVFDPQIVAPENRVVFIAYPDQNWAMFRYTKINSIESLIAVYHGHANGVVF